MNGSWILSGILALPLIGALFILLLPGDSEATKKNARWIALFATCVGDTLFPETGRAVVGLLERLGHAVEFPVAQTCCGQLHANSGYPREAAALAERFLRVFDGFDFVVSPSSSCVGTVREPGIA